LTFSFFSPYIPIAAMLFAGLLLGAFVWWRRDRYAFAVLVGFPVAYMAYFCGSYTIAVVRNYILLAPFLAVLAARGLGAVAERLGPRRALFGLAPVLGAVAVLHAVWLVRAGESIRTATAQTEVRDAIAWIAGHGRTRVRISERVRTLAKEQGLALPANVTTGPTVDAVAFFVEAEGPGVRWRTNDPWLTRAVFGPREVNLNWYSTWWGGRDHIVVMTDAKAKASGVALAVAP
jgi:hypothetical protein